MTRPQKSNTPNLDTFFDAEAAKRLLINATQKVIAAVEEEVRQGPSMGMPKFHDFRPNQNSATPELLIDHAKQQIERQLLQQRQMIQQWRNEPTKAIQKIQKMLARNPQVRQLVLGAGQGLLEFMQLNDAQKLQLVHSAKNFIQTQAKALQQKMQGGLDPTDSTQPLNQANPNNLTNQFFATQEGVTQNQNALNSEELETENLASTIVSQIGNVAKEVASFTKEIVGHLAGFAAGLTAALENENTADHSILSAIERGPIPKKISGSADEEKQESQQHSFTPRQ
jgi:hypothetical protein